MESMEKKTDLELTPEALAEVIAGAVKEHVMPVVEKVEDLSKRLEEINEKAPSVLDQAKAEDPDEVKAKAERAIAKMREKMRQDTRVPEDEFSFIRYFRAQLSGDWSQAPFEKFAVEEGAKGSYATKALNISSDDSGGYLVPEEFLPEEFVDVLYANVALKQAGIPTIQVSGSPVKVPKLTKGVTANWISDGNSINADGNAQAGEVSLTPHYCVGRLLISNTLVRSAAPAAEQIVRMDIARSLAAAVDKACLQDVTSGPTALKSVSGVNSAGDASTDLTFDLMRDALYTLEEDDVPLDGVCWILHPYTWKELEEMKASTAGTYFMNPNRQDGIKPQLFGYPVYRTTNIEYTAATSCDFYVLNIKDLIMAEWGGIDLRATDQGGDAWATNGIEVRGVYAVDIAPRRAVSVCKGTHTVS